MRRNQPTNDHHAGHLVILDIETIVPDHPADGIFPKWPNHRPVVASMLSATTLGSGKYSFAMASILCEPDDETAFYREVDRRLPPNGSLVGWNSTGFDIPALALGAIGARSFSSDTLSKLHRAYRFGPLHADLAELYSNYGSAARPSLAEVCGRLGVPVKVDVHGDQVGDLHARGEIDRIRQYCESDVAATAVAAWYWFAWRDSNDALLAEPLAAFAKWIEASPDRAHLLPVAGCEPARWARRRALQLSIDHAKVAVGHRIRHERDELAFSGRPVPLAVNDDDDPIF